MKMRLPLLMSALFCMMGGSAWALTFTQGNLEFTVTSASAKTVSVQAKSGISGNVTIPATVTYSGVTYTVTTIPESAFDNAQAVTSVSIPGTVKSLGNRAFGSCHGLTKITFEESSESLSIACGFYGSFQECDADKSVAINRNLVLGESSSPFSDVTSVVFGGKATAIANNLFQSNSKLASVTIGNSVSTIGSCAFYGCGTAESVSEMVVTMGSSVTTIGSEAFNGCSQLKSFTLPSTLKLIEGYAFLSTGLTGITIPASVDSLGDQSFGSIQNLASIRIEDGNRALKMSEGFYGAFAFSDTEKAVYVGRNLKLSTDAAPFPNATSVVFGDKVTTINNGLFQYAHSLSSVTIGKGVTTIGENAFFYCGVSEDVSQMVVKMGPSVVTIGSNAFFGCSQLKSVTLPSTLKWVGDYAFSDTGLTGITVPASVESLGNRAFGSCQNLGSIRIEDKAEALEITTGFYGTFAFSEAEKTVYIGRDLTLSGESDISPFSNVTSAVLGDKMTAVNDYLFFDASLLASVTIGSGVKTIGNNAFSSAGTAETVSELVVGMGKNVTAIGSYAFFGCSHLKSVTLPSTLKQIKNYAFQQTDLTGIAVPASVDSLGERVFGDCQSLTNVRIEDGTTALKLVSGFYGTFAFSDAVKDVYVGRNLTLLGETNVAPFSCIKNVVFGANVTAFPIPLLNSQEDLNSIKAPWLTPISVNTEHFSDIIFARTTLFVHGDALSAYKNHSIWKKFKNIQASFYTVTVIGAGITVSNTMPEYGEDVTVTILDDPDSKLASLLVNGTDVTAQVTNGQYVIYNITGNVTVEATFKSTKEFITMTGEYATFSCPQDLDFSGSSLRAFIASGFNKSTNQVLLTRVTDVPAGTGIFLLGTPGETYKVSYAETSSIYMNFFQANLNKSVVSATSGSYSNYAFGEQDGDPGFYPISSQATLAAQTAYLQLPTSFVAAGVKVSVVFEDDVIDGMDFIPALSENEGAIYNIAGQRLDKMQKGINIVNGKKVLVK